MKLTSTTLSALTLPTLLAVTHVAGICPGFNFGIGNVIPQGQIGSAFVNRWNVYDDSCNIVDGLTTSGNPCTAGIFGCTGSPITFNRYTSTFTGLTFACRTDPNSGRCGNDVISVCCRNDGH
ncbi:hypothetical protein CVT24_011013 [Panaeolus cyanescens]|uniref:Hydrophobin n=1 Tax=Panaeolus cyanescens TaxID=181874 RepID=A0A409YVC6_9AGAR|nr:hypothetical protein CVT24_011013 [Panaeolus cyanescens]